jgi:AcrR family transcriptional regulator
MRINRTTVYYHFESRDSLLAAVKHWSAQQLAKGLAVALPQQERMNFVTRFVLENAALIKLWIDDFIAPDDIRTRYPMWDVLVEGMVARSVAADTATAVAGQRSNKTRPHRVLA